MSCGVADGPCLLSSLFLRTAVSQSGLTTSFLGLSLFSVYGGWFASRTPLDGII